MIFPHRGNRARNIRNTIRASFAALVFFLTASPALSDGFSCAGSYSGHLQGIALEPGTAVYWSFTVALVKTDLKGRILTSIEVPGHHGDLTFHDGKVYVAVNLGAFNREAGEADSWVYEYDTGLNLLARHTIPEVVHGAGGMTWCDGHFFVVGGLPKGYTENYIYEYTGDFSFVRRHVIPSGFTLMGIQTADYHDGLFWFGCYGKPNNKPLLVTDRSFRIVGASDTDFSVGIAGVDQRSFLRGETKQDGQSKTWTGWVERVTTDTHPNNGNDIVFTSR